MAASASGLASASSATAAPSLEVEIEHNATIAKSCQIALHDIENNNNDDGSDGGGTGTGTADGTSTGNGTGAKIKLIITAGNVFHPHAKISIVPPPLPPLPSLPSSKSNNANANANANANGIEINVRIGANNLFEEESHLIIDLSQITQIQLFDIQDGDGDGDKTKEVTATTTVTVNAVGSYNHFAARCHVQAPKIGNANIFHPMSNIHIYDYIPIRDHDNDDDDENADDESSSAKTKTKTKAHIKNGNIFQSLCHIGPPTTINTRTRTGARIGSTCTPTPISPPDRFLALQEKVCFVMMRPEVDGYDHGYNYDHDVDHNHNHDDATTNTMADTDTGMNTGMNNHNTSTRRDKIKMREHRNGVKKNIQEVSMLLGTAKTILQSHHPLMETTK